MVKRKQVPEKQGEWCPYRDANWKTCSRENAKYVIYEPNKERDIQRYTEERLRVAAADAKGNIPNILPQVSAVEMEELDYLLKGNNVYKAYNAALQDVAVDGIKSTQPTLRVDSLKFLQKYAVTDMPVVIQLPDNVNVVVDGNHRFIVAKALGEKTVKAHFTKYTELLEGK